MKNLTNEQKFATARLKALMKMPYFSAALLGMNVVKVPLGAFNGLEGDNGTFGVTQSGTLLVQDRAIERWNIDEISGVLLHEVLHILRKHTNRINAIIGSTSLKTGTFHGLSIEAVQYVANVAADLEINDDLLSAGVTLPDTNAEHEKYNVEKGRMLEEYFWKLIDKVEICSTCGAAHIKKRGKKSSRGKNGNSSSNYNGNSHDHSNSCNNNCRNRAGSRNSSNSSQSNGHGDRNDISGKCSLAPGETCSECGTKNEIKFGEWCGSGAGRPLPGETSEQIQQALEGSGRSKAELEAIRRQVAAAIQEGRNRSKGFVPEGFVRWADEILKPPKIDWRTKLAQIARNAVAYRPGAVDYCYTRISRRQGGVGYGFGSPVLPAMQQPIPQVAVAIDTSGSMSKKNLTDAVIEASGILKTIGAEITFMACDAAVGTIKQVRSVGELCDNLVGGGGTSFVPVFEKLKTIKPRPEVLVYITDGCGDAPSNPPQKTSVIWVLVGDGQREPTFCGGASPWGDMIHIPIPSEEQPYNV